MMPAAAPTAVLVAAVVGASLGLPASAAAAPHSGNGPCRVTVEGGRFVGWALETPEGDVVMSGDTVAVHVGGAWWAAGASGASLPSSLALAPAPAHSAHTGGAAPPPPQSPPPPPPPRALEMVGTDPVHGTDAIGSFVGVRVRWSAGGTPWETTCKEYASAGAAAQPSGGGHTWAAVLTSAFPQGAAGTAVPGASASDGVLSNWPLARTVHANLTAALSWQSEFVRPARSVTYGVAGGPAVRYAGDDPAGAGTRPLVASALNHFKAASVAKAAHDGSAAAWAPGTAGTVTSLPAGFEHSWLVVGAPSGAGVTAAVRGWGLLMQRLHNTSRVDDITVTKLQYQTDNGAQYCFCKENCDEKLLAVRSALEKSTAPAVASLSFQGGWWKNPLLHTAGCAPWCVSSWEANTTKFPSGEKFHAAWGEPFQLYAPYFCRDTPYADRWPMIDSDTTLPGCGGSPAYAFKTPEPSSSEAFYTWLMGYGKEHWGMTSFEPDFLHQNFICVRQFLENATAAEAWFNGMAAAAAGQGLAMQWCMATPADVLNALSYPTVTNFRVTTDFYYGSSFDVGPGSLFTWALGVRPSKDTFWTSNQSDVAGALGGCPGSGCPADHSDAGAALHTLIATMTTGPVGFSDAAGRTNATLLAATALPDGTIVQPSRPATPIDLTYASTWSWGGDVGGSSPTSSSDGNDIGDRGGGGDGFVLATHSGDWGWYVFAHQLREPFHVVPFRDIALPSPPSPDRMLWRVWGGTQGACRNGSALSVECASQEVPVAPAATPGPEFYRPTLLVGSLRCASGWSVLGDLTRFASLSTSVLSSVECTLNGVRFVAAPFKGAVDVTVAAGDSVLVVRAQGGQTYDLHK